ncbi:MAG: DUF882 domain-containing protein [Phycisphaerae bacterium]|nr:DUF882 domain-containing protein [Phycisphaerae bacterium]NIU25992.1 DUF882 domain-containing protein [candidate division KSB1 bacterium]NIS54787.1 DUF882 domain-containing protein [Phycisphaerae bacterium]NIV01218.1 DUF882 domain-containing protein [Phycisphaerae bacterium]NIV71117.1 DUF882 domain-containing protein [Phycisphaerae bacterium]
MELETQDDHLTANFRLREFASRGTPVPSRYLPNVRRLAQNLQVLRDVLNVPIHINSGYRTPAHNRSVKGVSNSQHLTASAADIRASGFSPPQVYCMIERLIQQGRMVEGGLGIYNTFVHYDVRGRRARWTGRGVRRPDCSSIL